MEPSDTIGLPQYASSNDFMERFLDAIHVTGAEITRTPNTKGIKLVNGSELSADALSYFIDNKSTLENEFLQDLAVEIGPSKAQEFCQVIAQHWFDGRSKRESIPVLRLKAAIRAYLHCILPKGVAISDVVANHECPDTNPSLTKEEVAKVLRTNDCMIYKHIEEWLRRHTDSSMMARGDVFFRRGLSLPEPFTAGALYREWDFINSYSIAISAPEQFAQMQSANVPALVSADCDYFNGRILFFSPFVPEMPPGQLEVGVIPREKPDVLRHQGQHGGIYEYLIGDHPT